MRQQEKHSVSGLFPGVFQISRFNGEDGRRRCRSTRFSAPPAVADVHTPSDVSRGTCALVVAGRTGDDERTPGCRNVWRVCENRRGVCDKRGSGGVCGRRCSSCCCCFDRCSLHARVDSPWTEKGRGRETGRGDGRRKEEREREREEKREEGDVDGDAVSMTIKIRALRSERRVGEPCRLQAYGPSKAS